MAVPLPLTRFLQTARQIPVIDVRSPGEFEQGHLPGAHNIPLFTNRERAEVGTIYKQLGRDAAVLRGLELIGPKMAGFVRQSRLVAPGGEVLVHCWRGGMRSASFAWLLQTAGLRVAGTLENGYKAFRQEVLAFFEQPLTIHILGGKTGSGKTEILREMARQGEQIIDLEALARHKGSSFGAIGEAPQPTTEQFENELYAALRRQDLSRPIWLEDESQNIGTVRIPRSLFQQMRRAPVLFLEVGRGERIERLVRMYSDCEAALLADALHRIEKRLGGQHYQRALVALEQGDFAEVAAITLQYYDQAYLYGLENRPSDVIHRLETTTIDPVAVAQRIIAQAQPLFRVANSVNANADQAQ